MSESHYCVVHKVPFFKKGGMKGYAHPIGETGKWHNEEESSPEKPPESKQDAPQRQEVPLKGNESILRSVAIKGAVELVVAERIPLIKIFEWATLFESYVKGDYVLDADRIKLAFAAKVAKAEAKNNAGYPEGQA